jgi:hypothetical protein
MSADEARAAFKTGVRVSRGHGQRQGKGYGRRWIGGRVAGQQARGRDGREQGRAGEGAGSVVGLGRGVRVAGRQRQGVSVCDG